MEKSQFTGPKVKEAPEAPSLIDFLPKKKTVKGGVTFIGSPRLQETKSRESQVAALVDLESAVFSGAPLKRRKHENEMIRKTVGTVPFRLLEP